MRRTLACGLFGKRQRAQHSLALGQAWRHDVGVDLLESRAGAWMYPLSSACMPCRISGNRWLWLMTPPPRMMRCGDSVQIKATQASTM